MMKKFQRGATMWSTLSITLMIGFIAYLGFIVGDIFLDYRFIKSSMQDVVDQGDFKTLTNTQVLTSINKRLTLNNIRGLDKDVIALKKDNKTDEKYIKILYAAKANIASNVYILVEFDEEIRRTK